MFLYVTFVRTTMLASKCLQSSESRDQVSTTQYGSTNSSRSFVWTGVEMFGRNGTRKS